MDEVNIEELIREIDEQLEHLKLRLEKLENQQKLLRKQRSHMNTHSNKLARSAASAASAASDGTGKTGKSGGTDHSSWINHCY